MTFRKLYFDHLSSSVNGRQVYLGASKLDHICPESSSKIQTFERVLFWSDQHFWHKNVIEYCNRPFASVEDMTNFLVSQYIENVNESDCVVFGGDLSFKGVTNIVELFANLPGYKIGICGNHDVRQIKQNGTYYGFNEKHACLEYSENNQTYWITHFPIPYSLLPDHVINIHGHVHNNHPKISERHLNMCVECTNYTPISISALK